MIVENPCTTFFLNLQVCWRQGTTWHSLIMKLEGATQLEFACSSKLAGQEKVADKMMKLNGIRGRIHFRALLRQFFVSSAWVSNYRIAFI